MKKLSIQLLEGRKTLEKVEITSIENLESLFKTLKSLVLSQNNNLGLDFSESKPMVDTNCDKYCRRHVTEEGHDHYTMVEFGKRQNVEPILCNLKESDIDTLKAILTEDAKRGVKVLEVPTAIKNIDDAANNMRATVENLKTAYTPTDVDMDQKSIHEPGQFKRFGPTEIPECKVQLQCTEKELESLKALAMYESEFNSINLDPTPTRDRPKEVFEAFFIMKCPKCGKLKCFKSNTDTLFHCECGTTYSTSKYVKIYGKCPNCSNNVGTQDHFDKLVATLEGMDVSEGMRCNKCKSPIDFKYNEVKGRWVGLEQK